MIRIAVDMIPLLPGSENGGAKVLATELICLLSQLRPDWEFFLLTNNLSHDELTVLESENVRRLCVRQISPRGSSQSSTGRAERIRGQMKEWLKRSLPTPLLAKGKTLYSSLRSRHWVRLGIVSELKADLLFCPFTLPIFYDTAVPTVSIIYDLQYHYYPQFFERRDYVSRERNFRETCRLADRLVCISHFVRTTVLNVSQLPAHRVVSIPISLSRRITKPSQESTNGALVKYRLKENGFLFFPANFWPHKNHEMLFVSFGMFCSRHPEWALNLVCTGNADTRLRILQEAVKGMGLEERIIFPGYLSPDEFAALFSSCRALIFPSLYEGFGMPVLEAMNLEKPVLCSNVTSLPEVAGDAALYFDPRKPEEILRAMERMVEDSEFRREFIARGKRRVELFDDSEKMAREYLNVFEEVLR